MSCWLNILLFKFIFNYIKKKIKKLKFGTDIIPMESKMEMNKTTKISRLLRKHKMPLAGDTV